MAYDFYQELNSLLGTSGESGIIYVIIQNCPVRHFFCKNMFGHL